MLTPHSILYTDAQLAAAKITQQPITVWWRDGEVANEAGVIEGISKHAVKVNGEYYVRAACTFEVC